MNNNINIKKSDGTVSSVELLMAFATSNKSFVLYLDGGVTPPDASGVTHKIMGANEVIGNELHSLDEASGPIVSEIIKNCGTDKGVNPFTLSATLAEYVLIGEPKKFGATDTTIATIKQFVSSKPLESSTVEAPTESTFNPFAATEEVPATTVVPQVPIVPAAPVVPEVTSEPNPFAPTMPETPIVPEAPVVPEVTPETNPFAPTMPETSIVTEAPVVPEVATEPNPFAPTMPETPIVPEAPVVPEVATEPNPFAPTMPETPIVTEAPVVPEVATEPNPFAPTMPETPVVSVTPINDNSSIDQIITEMLDTISTMQEAMNYYTDQINNIKKSFDDKKNKGLN